MKRQNEIKDINQALKVLQGASWKGSVLGLGRMEEITELMGHPERKLRFVHIAGTNGKGSTAAILASCLKEAGYTTGLYTSPHLIRYNERFKVNGIDISDEELCTLAEMMKPFIERMKDKPTEFEVMTAAAFLYFFEKKCDIVVLETGLGGRLDATNVIPTPDVAVITHIGLEHTEILGDTYEKIASEKAGIIKEKGTLAYYPSLKEISDVYEKVCKDKGADLYPADFEAVSDIRESMSGSVFSWKQYKNLLLPMTGAHQIKNAVVALEAIEIFKAKGLSMDEASVRMGFKNVKWPARMEILSEEPVFILDGAHNPQCIDTVTDALKSLLTEKKVVFIIGLLSDKDYDAMTDRLMDLSRSFICLTPDSDRALPAEDLADFIRSKGADACTYEDTASAIAYALKSAGDDGAVVSLGSLYLAGRVKQSFEEGFKLYKKQI